MFRALPDIVSPGRFRFNRSSCVSWRSFLNRINEIRERYSAKAASELSLPLIIEDDPTYVPSKGWAEIIRKVYEVDPLICSSCGGRMRIISFIEEPKTIDRIIRHLKLSFQAEWPPPSHVAHQELLMAAEESGEYFT